MVGTAVVAAAVGVAVAVDAGWTVAAVVGTGVAGVGAAGVPLSAATSVGGKGVAAALPTTNWNVPSEMPPSSGVTVCHLTV